MKEKILQLRNEGKSYKEIREILKCSKSTISYHCGDGQKEKTKERLKLRRENILLEKVERFKLRKFKNNSEKVRKFTKRDNEKSLDNTNKNITPSLNRNIGYRTVMYNKIITTFWNFI